MYKTLCGLTLVGLLAPVPGRCADTAPVAALPMAAAAAHMVSDRLLAGMTGDAGRSSIRGTKALWTQVLLQGGVDGMPSLEGDLKRSDMDGQLREQGFRLMDPAKRSLALFGLRPTLVLVVFHSPDNPVTGEKAFYVVLASAHQDCTPLGGEEATMTTWAQAGAAIAASKDPAKDAEAIRASARDCVAAFIAAARSGSDGH